MSGDSLSVEGHLSIEDVSIGPPPSGLPRIPIPLMLVLTALTAGFYYPWWFLRRRSRFNQLNGANAIPWWPFALLAASLASRLALLIWDGPRGNVSSAVPLSADAIATLVLLAAWLLTVAQAFAIKGIIERHIAGPPTGGSPQQPLVVRLSAPQTFFFGPYYLQYAINTAVLIEYSSELIEQIEEAEGRQFIGTLIASTPSLLVTPAFIAINVLMFLVVAVTGRNLSPAPAMVARWGGDFGPLTTHGQWWRLLTSAFLHFGLIHLLMNVIILWQIGRLTERLFGHVGFTVAYVLAAVGASLASLWWNPMSVSAGASGAVFGLYGALGAFLLVQRASIPIRVLTTVANGAAAFVGVNLVSGLLWNAQAALTTSSAQPRTLIDAAGHIGGLVTGFVVGCALAQPLTPAPAVFRARRNLIVSIAGIIVAAVAVRYVPRVDDISAALESLRNLERRGVALYNDSLAKLQTHELQPRQFADIIDTTLLPPWNEARTSLLALRLPPPQRALALTRSAVMGWTADEWQLTAEGIRTNNVALIERAKLKRQAADEIKTSIAKRIAHATHPPPPHTPMVVGTITDRSHHPVPGANVEVACAPHAAHGSVPDAYWEICKAPPVGLTDNRGRFQFDTLPAGPYLVIARARDYREDERDFELDDAVSLDFTLHPLVDQVAAALGRVAAAEKASQAAFNGALARLRSHAIGSGQFADLVERQVLPPWESVESSLAALDVGDDRRDMVRKTAKYMALRAEGWRLLAQAVRTNDAGMMKKASETQTAAVAVLKGVAPAASNANRPRARAAVPH